jgi:8-oxo-dGTP pyrophosphatase MutT (NUDIX family)
VTPVRAAGAIVVRRRGRPDVLLVHRPKYEDWSFPKGKAEEGESDEECAVRELDEEVGIRARLGPELGRTRYRDARGRPKEVVYFRAEADDEPTAGDGVDDVRWASVDDALQLLTWQRDRDLLASARERL